VLTQKNVESNEISIDFMRSSFKGVELNYPTIYQQAYAIFKAMKHFRSYLLKSRTKVIVPYPAVRNLLVQKEPGEKRENWMMSLQKYDLEITPTQIFRGQGFCKLVAGSVEEQESQINTSSMTQHNEKQISCAQATSNSWYENIRFYLTHGYDPHNIDPKNKRVLRFKSTSF
jgi:hypothetical protein